MRLIFTAPVFAFLVVVGVVPLGAGCAAPSARKDACESACVNAEDESCRRCRENEAKQERRRREAPPPSFPSGGGGGMPY
jgi:hypothetical protein